MRQPVAHHEWDRFARADGEFTDNSVGVTYRGRALADPWAEAGYWGGSVFWDSDLAKWLEAASARLEQTRDPALEARVDEIIGLFERAQLPDGYVNSHILTWRPEHRFKNLRDLHELYCAGHLIEAAVVHFEATGKDRLLRIAQHFKEIGEATIRARPELKPGTRLMRQWQGRTYDVQVLDDGFSWQGTRYRSLSAIARQITGTAWSGPLFFGLKQNRPAARRSSQLPYPAEAMESGDAAR